MKSRIGLEHAGFGDERRRFDHMRITAQLPNHRVRHNDRLHVVGVVIIKRNNLYMCPETRYLVCDRLLETHHDTNGQYHHHYADDHTR